MRKDKGGNVGITVYWGDPYETGEWKPRKIDVKKIYCMICKLDISQGEPYYQHIHKKNLKMCVSCWSEGKSRDKSAWRYVFEE